MDRGKPKCPALNTVMMYKSLEKCKAAEAAYWVSKKDIEDKATKEQNDTEHKS